MKWPSKRRKHILIILILVIGITTLHYLTRRDFSFQHVFYRELYFLPIILSSFWFGLRGGLAASLSITILYFPFVVITLENFTAHELGSLLEICLYNLVGGMLGWLRDREVKRQNELRKAESLAAMGKAVSCIAHDMKTPLVAIGGLTAQVLRKVPLNDLIYRKLNVVMKQSERLEHLVKDMLVFARPLELQETEGDLHELIYEVVEVASEIAKQKEVRITVDTERFVSSLFFDNNRFQQMMLNLLSNAIEASPVGEEVVVRIYDQSKKIFIEVTDFGPGIPLEHAINIFNPFFSTKKTGTGLGLPIVKKIVEAHGGSIELQNNQDKGATFLINIPK